MRSLPRTLTALAMLPACLAALGACDAPPAPAAAPGGVPVFEVDHTWPPPLPNNWIFGEVRGIFVDSRDHVWIVHMPSSLTRGEMSAALDPPAAECCAPAPPVVEFDPDGNVVQAWGGPDEAEGYVWPVPEHGLFMDHNGYIWIGSSGQHHVLKLTRDGEHVMTIGDAEVNRGSNDPNYLGAPASFHVDPETNELFVADGYRNRRVVVFDAETGEYLRHWGAYGERPDDGDVPPYDPDGPPSPQFQTVHGLTMSHDRLIYVADRRNNRIQVFRPDGEFVMERIVAPSTLGSGSAFSFGLSHDPEQTFLYLMDGMNNKMWILRREDLEIVGELGSGGRQAGQFLRAHMVGVDSQGNLYTGEAGQGRRLQKFTFLGFQGGL